MVDIPWCVRTLTPPFGSRRFGRRGRPSKKKRKLGFTWPSQRRASPRARCISTDFNLHTRVGSRPRGGMLLVSPRSNIIVERFRVNSSRQTPFSSFSPVFPLFSYIVKLTGPHRRNTDNIVEGEGYTFHTFGRHMTRPRHVASSLIILLVNLLIIEIVWLLFRFVSRKLSVN